MNESLYGEPAPAPAASKAPSLMEQVEGVFTSPGQLFQRLGQRASWFPSLALTVGISIAASLAWAAKVDLAAQKARQLEVMQTVFHMQIPDSAADQAISQVQGTHPWVSSVLGPLIGTPIIYLIVALIIWAFAAMGRSEENHRPSLGSAFTVTSIHYLSTLPSMLAAGLLCALKPVGGRSIQEMMPTVLTFFVHPDSALLRGLCFCIDPLWIFSFFVLAAGLKHSLKAKPWAIASCLALFAVLGVGFRFLGALFF